MSRVVVDLERLADLVDRLDAYATHLARTCEHADAQVRQMHELWTGSAAAAQAAAHARWRAAADQVSDALGALRSIGATAHANYSMAASANRRMWSG